MFFHHSTLVIISLIEFSGLDYSYDKNSAKKAETFINNCKNKMGQDCKLWIAFKVNAIHDVTKASSSFDNAFKGMTKKLQENGIHLSSLGYNMRNGKSIGACSKNLQSFSSTRSDRKMVQQIEALEAKSNVDSCAPLHIPINSKNWEQDLPKAMTLALERTKKETKNVVVLHDPRLLSSNLIQKVLMECGEEEKNILLHPKKPQSPQRLIKYLRQPNGFYVVPEDNFDGMESKSIIFLLHDEVGNYLLHDDDAGGYRTTSVRSHISRAINGLCIVHELEPNVYDKNNTYLFPSMEVDPSFMECNKVMKFEAFKCDDKNLYSYSLKKTTGATGTTTTVHHGTHLTTSSNQNGKDKLICYPCILYCHQDHEDQSFVKLGGSTASSVLGHIGRLSVDGARRIKCSIMGETKCRCGEITQCQLEKN